MQIDFGNAKDMAQLVKLGVNIIRELDADGTLSGIEDSFHNLRRNFREQTVELDISQYSKYVQAGMIPEHAILLMMSEKMGCRMDLAKIISKK